MHADGSLRHDPLGVPWDESERLGTPVAYRGDSRFPTGAWSSGLDRLRSTIVRIRSGSRACGPLPNVLMNLSRRLGVIEPRRFALHRPISGNQRASAVPTPPPAAPQHHRFQRRRPAHRSISGR